MSNDRLKHIALGVAFLLLQIVLFRHLNIFRTQPDLVLIFLVWYMSKRSRTSSLLMAAFLGLTQDFFLDIWGLNMFTKTLVVYLGHRFIPRAQKTRVIIGHVFFTVLSVAFLHNFIFQGLNIFTQSYSGETLFWRHLIGNSLYSAVVACFIHLFKTKR